MPANTKWTDFQFASKLRHFMGSQPTVPEGIPAEQRDKEYIDDSQDPGLNERSSLMSGPVERQVEVEVDDDLDGLSHGEGGVDLDATDYGDLEMFDSNASQVFYPEPSDMMKPELSSALMQMSPSKRDRKKKKKEKSKGKAIAAAADDDDEENEQDQIAELEQASVGKKRRRSKKNPPTDPQIIDSQLLEESMPGSSAQLAQSSAMGAGAASNLQSSEAPAVTSSQSNKKRGPSDSAEGKHRKKKKSKGQPKEDLVQATQDDVSHFKTDPAFLRTHGNDGPENPFSSMRGGLEQDPDSELSPSVARVRRRSQSAGPAHSRESSVPFRAAVAPMAPMAIDGLPRESEMVSMNLGAAIPPPAGNASDADVETLARQAWREHVSTQQNDEMDSSYEDDPESDPESGQGVDKRRDPKGKKPNSRAAVDAGGSAAVADAAIDPNLSAKAPSQKKSRGKIAVKSSKGKPPTQEKKQSGSRQKQEEEGDEEEAESNPVRYKANGYTQGRFSDEELARITKAVESFRQELNLSQFDVNEMIHTPGGTAAGSTHAQLWLRLTAECPDRKRQKVINVTRKKFHNFIARGTWNAEQDAELAALINVHATAWSKIAAIINRHPEDVRDRYRNYIVCGASQRKDVWDEEEEERLRFHVKHAMDSIDELRKMTSSDKNLLNSSYEELIDWQSISEKMDRTRSRLQCITKWKLMTKRSKEKKAPKFGKNEPSQRRLTKLEGFREQLRAMDESEQYRLVLAIHKAGVASDAQIPWDKLVDKAFRNTWSRGCQLLLWHRLKQSVPEWDKKTLREITQYIINLYSHTGRMPEFDQAPDDEQELELIMQARPRDSTASQPKSAEVVEDSGAEDEVARDANEDDVGDLELNIDPALSQTAPVDEQPAVKNKKEKQAAAKKAPAKRRSARAAKEAGEPAKATDPSAETDTADAPGEVVSEELPHGTRSRKKNASPSKTRSSARGKDTKAVASGQQDASDSEMDDIGDLPARV